MVIDASRAWRRRPASSSRCARCGTSPSSPSSTRWTARPATPSTCMDEIENGARHRHLSHQLADRLRQHVQGRLRPRTAGDPRRSRRVGLRQRPASAWQGARPSWAPPPARRGWAIGLSDATLRRRRAARRSRPTTSTSRGAGHGKLSLVILWRRRSPTSAPSRSSRTSCRWHPAAVAPHDGPGGAVDPLTTGLLRPSSSKSRRTWTRATATASRFMRICSGKFERGMDALHVQAGRKIMRSSTGTSR